MKLIIKINLDNAAFDKNAINTGGEVQRILNKYSEDIQLTVNTFKELQENKMQLKEYGEDIIEVNGNKCGNYKVKL